ncbi:MAG: hypothetical protein ACKOXK_03905 [Chakrabartia sp.]
MAERKRYPTAVTPKGTAIYPSLTRPDTKFDPEGVYKVKLALDADDPAVQAFRKRVDDMVDAEYDAVVEQLKADGKAALAAKWTKKSPFTAEEDANTGEETGRLLINTKMKASGVTKEGRRWERKPDLFDATGRKLTNPPVVGGGSELKLSVELYPFAGSTDRTVSLSFRLNAAQIIKLVQFGARDAAGFGFEAEEGDAIEEENNTPFATAGQDDYEDDGL